MKMFYDVFVDGDDVSIPESPRYFSIFVRSVEANTPEDAIKTAIRGKYPDGYFIGGKLTPYCSEDSEHPHEEWLQIDTDYEVSDLATPVPYDRLMRLNGAMELFDSSVWSGQ